MTVVNLGIGLAPDVVVLGDAVYVAYGQDSPSTLVLVRLDREGHELERHTVPDGFFNAWPRFSGPWLAYKRGDPTYGPALLNVQTGVTATYPGIAAGNYGLAINADLGVLAYQNGNYPIWFGRFAGGAGDSGLQGAPDGLDIIQSLTSVTLRKDTRTSVPGLYYPVRAADVTVGEWFTAPYGLGVQLAGDALRVALVGQDCPTPRCATDGTTYALVTGGAAGVRVWLGSRADVAGLPPASSLAPPVADGPIGPRSAPRATDGRLYDMAPFIHCDPALAGRGGSGQQDNIQVETAEGILLYGKFGQTGAYEMYGVDANWMYSLEDASGPLESQSWTDPRWFPMHMAIGEAHAFVTGPHESVWKDRRTCRELRRSPFNRKMWLHALWDRFYWGPELGERATIMRVYDPTDGIFAPDRFIEARFEAVGAGWCRWDLHRSDRVYPRGPNGGAEFTDASLVQRVVFYRLGGSQAVPALTGCVPQRCPTYPPWEPNAPTDHTRSHKEGGMEINGKIVVLRGPKGMLMRPDAPGTGIWKGADPKGTWRGALWDVADSNDLRAHYLAAKLPSGRYTFTNIVERCLAGQDAGQYAPNVLAQFYHKPTDNTDAGDLEQSRVYEGNENGAIEAQMEQVTDGGHPSGAGKKFFTYPLAVEVVG